MDRPGVKSVPEGSGQQGKVEKTGRKIICGAPTTLAVKGLMMMMMIPSSDDRCAKTCDCCQTGRLSSQERRDRIVTNTRLDWAFSSQ